uniref:Uncharacterized protein n=1 Tax=Timema monikensis TaxID=170555 RepID=A0A7R9EJL6_9NEOP|nr:unnamed protein product [Timema monikensis]
MVHNLSNTRDGITQGQIDRTQNIKAHNNNNNRNKHHPSGHYIPPWTPQTQQSLENRFPPTAILHHYTTCLQGTSKSKRSRAEGDVRRLVTKVRGLEQINDALKSELSVFHQWASQQTRPLTRETSVNTSEGPPMMDKSTSVQSGPVNTAELLREIRRQREKLESSLRHNDQMRVALEGVLSAAVGAGEVSRVMDGVKEVTDRLDDATSYNHALEEQLKLSRDTVSSLEQQLATLTSRLHESDNEVLERKCLLLEMENQANQQSLELHHQIVALEMRLQETEQALSRANTRIQDLEAKESSLESKLRDAEESASKRLQEVDKKLQEAERLKEQFEAGIHCQKEEADRIRVEADARVQEAHDKFKTLKDFVLGPSKDINPFNATSRSDRLCLLSLKVPELIRSVLYSCASSHNT